MSREAPFPSAPIQDGGHDPPDAKLVKPLVPAWWAMVCAASAALALVYLIRDPGSSTRPLWPGYAQAESETGYALLQMGLVEEALAHCQKAVELGPDHAWAHNNLGNALLAAKRREEARQHYAEAVRLDPAFGDAHYNLGNLWLQDKRVSEAQAAFETTVQLLPAHPDAHYNLGFLHLGAGRLEPAREHYAEAVRLRPAHAPAHSSLGLVLMQLGRSREAVEQFDQALKLDARLLSALNNLAWILATAPEAGLRNGARALELATRADEVADGRSPGVLKTLAAAYAESGRFLQALEVAKRAQRLAREQGATELTAALDECLGLFESGRPCRDATIR